MAMRKVWFLVGAIGYLPAVLPVYAGAHYNRSHPLGLPYYQPYGRWSMDYETPHIPWGKPLAGGPISALVLAPEWTHRESVELAQRLDLKVTPWMCFSTKEVTTETADPALASFLVSKAYSLQLLDRYLKRPFDVYVVGKLDWSMLPAESRFTLLKKVSQGAGLILICPPSHEELTVVLGKHPTSESTKILSGVPWRQLPRLRMANERKLVQTARFGKGRVVRLDYQQPGAAPVHGQIDTGMHSLTPDWVQARNDLWPRGESPELELVPYEYYQSLVARAVRWAAGRDAGIQLTAELPERVGAQTAFSARLGGLPADGKWDVRIRDAYGRERAISSGPDADGRLTAPGLPGGSYLLDCRAMDGRGRVLDWASFAFSVRSENTVTAIALAARTFQKGDRVKGRVTLENALSAGEQVDVSLWDNDGRKIDEDAVAMTGRSGAFDLGPLVPLTTMHQVRAQLTRGGRVLSESRYEFPVRLGARPDDFSFVCWADYDNSFPTWAMLKKLHDQDEADVIDALPGTAWLMNRRAGSLPKEDAMAVFARNVARAGLQILPYNSRFGCLTAPKDTHIADPAVNLIAPAMRAKVKADFTADARIYGPFGPYAWTHGDESNYSMDPDVDWGQGALTRFRGEARAIYRTLDALNKEWKTAYTTWDQVMPLTLEQARKTRNYAPWVVHRLASDALYAEFFRFAGDALRTGDAGARTGFDGGCGLTYPNLGSDWWRLASHIQVFETYHSEDMQMEVWRSFAPPTAVRAMWYGTYGPTWAIGPNTIEFCHYFPWYSVFHGLNAAWFWIMGSPGPWSGYAPDLTDMAFMDANTQAIRQIKSGIGKLLLASRRNNDQIAIHWSESSRLCDAFYQEKGSDGCRGYEKAVSAAARMLEDAGFQYQFAAYAQVEKGELRAGGYKVFLMPHSRAVSPAEAEAVRAFVNGGGVVFADVLPGLHNAHGALVEGGLLTDLFSTDPRQPVKAVGAGRTVLYGTSWNDYGETHASGKGWRTLKDSRQSFAKLLERHASLTPGIKIVPIGGGKRPPTEIARFDAGGIELAGLVRSWFLNDHSAYPAIIRFGRSGYLYDLRHNKPLGQGREIAASLDYEAELFAVSPYRVDQVVVDGPEVTKAGSGLDLTIGLKITGSPHRGLHVFHLTVTDPTGKDPRHYAQNILAPGGAARALIPFALNDPPGVYGVKVRDVMSGAAGDKKITLEAK